MSTVLSALVMAIEFLVTSDIKSVLSRIDTDVLRELCASLIEEGNDEIASLQNRIRELEVTLRLRSDPDFLIPTNDEIMTWKGDGIINPSNKVGAVKMYRARTGAGLKESKDALENATK